METLRCGRKLRGEAMEVFHSTYYGINIYRHSINGMWIARYNGRYMADTLDGLKQMLRKARQIQHLKLRPWRMI